MTQDEILGLVRHVLTVAGTWLVTNGWATASQVQDVAGAVAIIGAFAWSVYNKKTHATAVTTAAKTGVDPAAVKP